MKRLIALRVALVAVFALLVSVAHATPPPAIPTARVAGALFTPRRDEDGLAWRARFVLSLEDADELARNSPRAIRFALPLGEGASLAPHIGITPLEEGGHVVGVVVSRSALRGREVDVTVQQHLARDRDRAVLAAPLAAGSALQILDADLGSGTRLEIAPNAVLERHVGFMAPAGTSLAAREEARRLTGYEERVSGAAVYLRGDDVRAAGGLAAVLETPKDRGRPGVILAALAFGGVVGALAFAAHRLRHAATVERADALLAAEVDALVPERRS